MKIKLKYIKMQMRIKIGMIEGTPLKRQTEHVNNRNNRSIEIIFEEEYCS